MFRTIPPRSFKLRYTDTMLSFFVPGIIIAAVGFGAVYLFTKPGGRLRAWITRTPNRIAGLGITILLLFLVGIATYNEATHVDYTAAGQHH